MLEQLVERRDPVYKALAIVVGLVVVLAAVALVRPELLGLGSDSDAASPVGSLEAGPSETEPAAIDSRALTDDGSTSSLDYDSNLAMLRAASVRNTNHDDSPYHSTPSDELVPADHYGPRAEYLGRPGGNPEQSFPIPAGGQFRAGCEFSHFSYDDPLVFPGRPGASHLHMHFGNTDVNAFSTFQTLLDSGSSTCNGQELNRTGYWVPAMFDAEGNVRVPERVVVYYKGEGRARGEAQAYPDEAALIATDNFNALPEREGGVSGKLTYSCSDNFSTPTSNGAQTIPACNGSRWKDLYDVDTDPHVVLEMNVKFPQCWNGEDPSDWNNFKPPAGAGWYTSNCSAPFDTILPNLEYFVNYKVEIGETTEGWFLSSDVDPTTFGVAKAEPGSTSHGDWWGAWNAEVADLWIENCVNFKADVASGCGFGYLTDGGPDGKAPVEGPALKIRPQYDGPNKVPAETLLRELCPSSERSYSKPEDAAFCVPGTGV